MQSVIHTASKQPAALRVRWRPLYAAFLPWVTVRTSSLGFSLKQEYESYPGSCQFGCKPMANPLPSHYRRRSRNRCLISRYTQDRLSSVAPSIVLAFACRSIQLPSKSAWLSGHPCAAITTTFAAAMLQHCRDAANAHASFDEARDTPSTFALGASTCR